MDDRLLDSLLWYYFPNERPILSVISVRYAVDHAGVPDAAALWVASGTRSGRGSNGHSTLTKKPYSIKLVELAKQRPRDKSHAGSESSPALS